MHLPIKVPKKLLGVLGTLTGVLVGWALSWLSEFKKDST